MYPEEICAPMREELTSAGFKELKTIEQVFKERGSYKVIDTIKGKDMLGWRYSGPFDELDAQSELGG